MHSSPTSHNNHSNLSLLSSNNRSFILSLYLKQTNKHRVSVGCTAQMFLLDCDILFRISSIQWSIWPNITQSLTVMQLYCKDLFYLFIYLFIYFATHKQHYKVLKWKKKRRRMMTIVVRRPKRNCKAFVRFEDKFTVLKCWVLFLTQIHFRWRLQDCTH